MRLLGVHDVGNVDVDLLDTPESAMRNDSKNLFLFLSTSLLSLSLSLSIWGEGWLWIRIFVVSIHASIRTQQYEDRQLGPRVPPPRREVDFLTSALRLSLSSCGDQVGHPVL